MQASMLNLVLAGVWLALAALAFAQPYINPDGHEWVIPAFDSKISVGWAALVLCAYNVIRWAASRRQRPPRPARPTPPRPIDESYRAREP